jgi:hypothetical protein
MIAVSILAFVSIFTTQAIQRAIRNKAKIQNQMDRRSQLRDALQVMSKDINLAFHYYDINVDLYNQAWKERIRRKEEEEKKAKAGSGSSEEKTDPAGEPTSPTTPPSTAESDAQTTSQSLRERFKEKKQKNLTQFLGEAKSLHFTSLNHVRTQKESKQSDQMEVGYYLDTCRGRINKDKTSECLWRRVSPIIDDKVDEGGTASVLLENVTRFELRYLGQDYDGEYTENWKSAEAEARDDRQKGNFPDAVEITLEIQDKSQKRQKPLAMTLVAPIRFPNNKKKVDPSAEQSGTSSLGGSGADSGSGSQGAFN